MIDTSEGDLAPGVAAAIRPLYEKRRELANSVPFAKAEAGKAIAGSGFFGSHPRPVAVFDAPREANSLLTRSSAAPKKCDNTRGDVAGICDENIALTVARRTSVCDKNFDHPANLMCPISARNSAQPPRLFDQRQGCDDDPEQ